MIDSLVKRLIVMFIMNIDIEVREKEFPHNSVMIDKSGLHDEDVKVTSWKDRGNEVVFEFTYKDIEYRGTIPLLYLLALNVNNYN